MTPGQRVVITSGPYLAQHGTEGVVKHHAPGTYLPVMLPVGDFMVTADVLPGEIEVAA